MTMSNNKLTTSAALRLGQNITGRFRLSILLEERRRNIGAQLRAIFRPVLKHSADSRFGRPSEPILCFDLRRTDFAFAVERAR
jgi:hypothetical protein